MKLSSARSLKEELLQRAYQAPGEDRHTRTYKARRANQAASKEIEVAEPVPMAAVGVAPDQGNEYKLAIRVFHGFNQVLPNLLGDLDPDSDEIDLVTGIRYKPRQTVRAGGSMGHYKITAGTLGGFVEDENSYYMMSNNHVFANSNQCFQGDPILEPGPADITTTFDITGVLDRWWPLSKTDRNGVDAAIATFGDDVQFFHPWTYQGVGTIQKTHVTDRFSVTNVIKRGRTTGVTRGTVSAFELDGVGIDYGTPSDPAVVVFDGQLEFIGAPPNQPFSQPGDSGSFIIDADTMQVYALLYGGGVDSQGIDRTLAHFIPDVFDKFGVTLVQ